jgi:hypothetical protein
MPKLNPDRHITRANHLDANGNPASGGYMVRFFRRGKSYQAYFSDVKFGTQKKALKAAREHRDEMEPKYRTLSPLERAKMMTANNTSGTVGVRWVSKTIAKGDKKYSFTFATASWSIKGERKTRAFSVDKYGKEEAWKMAVKARQAGLKEIARTLKEEE